MGSLIVLILGLGWSACQLSIIVTTQASSPNVADSKERVQLISFIFVIPWYLERGQGQLICSYTHRLS